MEQCEIGSKIVDEISKKEEIKKEIIIDLLIDKLFGCLEVENGKVHFDKYDISSKEVLFLLEHYDKERYDAYCKLLLIKNED